MKIAANFIQTDFGGNFRHAGKVQVCKLMLFFSGIFVSLRHLTRGIMVAFVGLISFSTLVTLLERGSDGLGGIYLEVSNALLGAYFGTMMG